MKILVTGGAGFIGSHLCRRLARSGHDVASIDLRDSEKPVPGVRYYRDDVLDSPLLKELVEGADTVYHFAALVSVPLCRNESERSYEFNLLTTVRVLECLRKARAIRKTPPKLVFSGSSVVYGGSAERGERCGEERALDLPRSLYGAQKLACEHAIRLFVEDHGIPAIVFRFFNVFGPEQDATSPYSGVVTTYASALDRGESLRLNGGGFQTRDFISVLDVTKACELVLGLSDSECDGKPINLGSGRAVTIRELAEMMMRISGRDVPLTPSPTRAGDIRHSLADITRAEQVLSWHPRISLEQGLAQLLPHHSIAPHYPQPGHVALGRLPMIQSVFSP